MARKLIILLFSAVALGSIGYGARRAVLSPLYTLGAVEITTDSSWKDAPLSEERIRALTNIPQGDVSLFGLDLESVRCRLLEEPWIEQVSLRKRFPQTLAMHVSFRRPVAVWLDGKGRSRYLDETGNVFGSVSFSKGVDLPVLLGVPEDRIAPVLGLIRAWQDMDLDRVASLSEIGWFGPRGLRAMLVVPGPGDKDGSAQASRPLLEMGQRFDADIGAKLERLAKVLRYLVAKQEQVSGILVGDDKKIVVRTSHGS